MSPTAASALGGLLVLVGGAGTVMSVIATSTRPRPIDLLAALAAPLAFVLLIVGAILLFVPQFLS